MGLKDIQIVGAPSGDFIFVVAVDQPRDQEKIPKFLDDIPVRVVVREAELLDEALQRVKAIQDRHADELFEYEGIVAFMIREEGAKYFFEIAVKNEEDLLYVPKEIEGVEVISRATGEIRPLDTCIPRPSPCDHRLTGSVQRRQKSGFSRTLLQRCSGLIDHTGIVIGFDRNR
jgi:hypothetical protein